jgi:hypothetical protein
MSLVSWFKNQMLALSVALSNVEKAALGQGGDMLSDDAKMVQRHRQGMLSDDLLHGKITQEVITLRARMYKVLEAAENYSYSDGERGFRKDRTKISKNIKGEPSDDYKVEMVFSNEKIPASFLEAADDVDTKPENAMVIDRSITPKFKIEDYTDKLYVKNIDEETKLLEFHINKYSDVYDKKTVFLINDIKKAIKNPRVSDLLDIDRITFITYNTLGVKNFMEFQYDVIGFHKIIEHEGNFVIKFKCKPIVNGKNIVEEFKDEELDKRYANKEKRK